ncbi:succinylglutamate desuccinylase/aspartoacylase family protein [Neptunitalea lumnitzerae]|uniref:Succinylglutamate desuccinylase n=1 Tax=Neptunitalea lumnitzerae TaxID=2965509 RepID=A0ABQ5MIA7_9FLAO|nr:succinylglutamate desuccinylase/aspartoacylase family protein [Neptunitalea sp. Y10]GLB49120.1 succinylglutamate desuccinylase [Neptunitalea sp. Y10]
MKIYSTVCFFLICNILTAQGFIANHLANAKPSKLDTIIKLHTYQGTSVDFPLTIIKGAKTGPTFTLIAGIHGMEYPPILAASNLRNSIKPNSLKGNVIIVPLANINAFYKRTPFTNPIDNKNLNRVFPGNKNGSITQVIAHFITQELFAISTVVLDIHAGDVNEDLLPFICYYNNTSYKEQTKLAATLCDSSGFTNIVSYPYTLGANEPAEYAFKQAVQQGITGISIEMGKLGLVSPTEVNTIEKSVLNILAKLQMYKQPESHNFIKRNYFTNQKYIYASAQGILNSSYRAGDVVKKGTIIGTIKDIFGNELSQMIAPETGTILYKIGTPPVNKDETVFCIGIQK